MKQDIKRMLFKDTRMETERSLPGRAGGVLFWILVWALGAALVDFPLVFPGPLTVCRRLLMLMTGARFWLELARSSLRILAGLVMGAILGGLSGMASFRSRPVRAALDPLFQIFRSVPIAAVIILFMVWIRPAELSTAIVVLAVSPLIYLSTVAGLSSRDLSLLEMAYVFRLSRRLTFRVAYLPSLKEQLKPALLHASGYAWKAGISGEIIAQPFGTMGSAMVGAKITLAVDTLFAYVLIIVLVAVLFNAIAHGLINRLNEKPVTGSADRGAGQAPGPLPGSSPRERWPHPKTAPPPVGIRVSSLTHSYGPLKVLADFDAEFPAGEVSVVMGATGIGKTTLFRLLLGLEHPEQGRITLVRPGGASPPSGAKYSCCFQEPRLVGSCSGLWNLELVNRDRALCLEMLSLAGISQPHQAVAQYSGGMQQKVALLRTLLSDSEIILLDEPFKALDQASKQRMMDLVSRWSRGKTIILSTHSEDERAYFKGHELLIGASTKEERDL